jgi:phenylalanyl-tRNA synthetase beta chain
MKLPINSIKEFSKCDTSLDTLVDIVSTKIGSIEEILTLSKVYTGIYVGQILKKRNHPDADKLAIYDLNLGQEDEIQVVAGDKTLKEGDKVAYIKPGHIVPATYNTSEPFKIKAMKIKGILSNGMICSEKELNIGLDNTKVFVLDNNAKVGSDFADYYDFNDTIIDIENKALTNRGDLFGIIGLAREISAAQGIPFVSPDWYKREFIDSEIENDTLPLDVKNCSSNLCPRYMCISIKDINVKPSPVWLKSLLTKSGVKPINNIVDITNYLSILTGQPLHAFDYDKVIKKDPHSNGIAHINVRLAKDGEKIHTLDGKVVELNSNNLVIADSTNPIAIGGVIGGIDTQIDEETRNIILESASFDRFSIRRTSMELGIFTEAVTRYTRGQNPNLCLTILQRAIDLILELAQGQIASNIKDIYPNHIASQSISLSVNRLNTHLGTKLSKEDITEILLNIEYQIVGEVEDNEYLTVIPPLFRTDLFIPEDIYEDIGRIHGYKNIDTILPKRDLKVSKINNNVSIKKDIRNILSNSGCNEIYTYSFTNTDTIKKSNQNPNLAFNIKNALSPELSLMRTSLLTSLLEKGQLNIQKNHLTFCIYELNISHQKGYLNNFKLPKEDWHLGLLFCTKENILHGNPYYQVKKYFEKIANKINLPELEFNLIANSSQQDIPIWVKNLIPTFDPNCASYIEYVKDGKTTIIGIMGNINQEVKNNFKLPQYTGAFEINIEEIKRLVNQEKMYIEDFKYPPISQDICFTVPIETKYKDIKNIIHNTINNKQRRSRIECLDIFKKDKLYKNVTVRVSIEHKRKTLTDSQYQKIKEKIEQNIKQSFN